MRVKYHLPEINENVEFFSSISESTFTSLPRIFPINKEIRLLSCNDQNYEIYKSAFGFLDNKASVWIEFPKSSRGSFFEYFLIGISINYLKSEFAEIEMIDKDRLRSIIDISMNEDIQLNNLLDQEFKCFIDVISKSGITSKNVSTFAIKVAYYFNVLLIKKVRQSNLKLDIEHCLEVR